MFFRLLLSLPLPFHSIVQSVHHSQVNLLRCIVVIENSYRKVSQQVSNEETPIVLRHGRRGEIQEVDDVDPHVASVVGEVGRDDCLGTRG